MTKDETGGAAIAQQRFVPDEANRNRLDFVTLRGAGIALYYSDAILLDDLRWYRQHGYGVLDLDGTPWRELDDLFNRFAIELRFPDYFGGNLDAFSECLSEDSQVPESGLVILIRGIDTVVKKLGREFTRQVLDTFCRASREQLLYDRRLIFLLHSRDPALSFDTVGTQPVGWNQREFLNSSRGL